MDPEDFVPNYESYADPIGPQVRRFAVREATRQQLASDGRRRPHHNLKRNGK